MKDCDFSFRTDLFGSDDALASKGEQTDITPVTELGTRGQAVYTVKTAYTDISIDGKKDPAYDYGVHLKGLMVQKEYEDYYKGRPTDIDIYMVRGQDGRLYIFGHITDPDLFVKEEFFKDAVDQCDVFTMYFDYMNMGLFMSKVARVLPYDGSAPFPRRMRDCKVVFTPDGYDFECALDDRGKPFTHGQTVGFSFFYRDTNDFVDDQNYKKIWTKLPSELERQAGDFVIPPYFSPDGKYSDTLRFSEDSVSDTNTCKSVKSAYIPTGEMLYDILNGESTVCVVGGGRYCPIQTILSALDVNNFLSKHNINSSAILECQPSHKNDFEYEIIFNDTLRKGGNRLCAELSPNEYAMEFEEKRILIYAPLEKSADIVTKKLLSVFEDFKNGKSAEELKKPFYGKLDGIKTDNVPKPQTIDQIGDVGDNAYVYITFDVNKNDLADYRRALEEKGWSLYTQNEMAKIKTFTYTGFGAVITVVYSDDCAEGLASSLRVVVEPAEKTTLPMLEPEPYEKKVTPSVSMLDPNNLCMVYKLANGEFLILDGGQMPTYRNLYNILMEQSDDGKPVIAAWFFSHFHQDHDGSFVTMVEDDECLKDLTIKRIIYNYPQKLVSDTARNKFDQQNLLKWQSLLDKTGAKIYQARTGQKYYFAGAELELLWTFEDLVPYNLFDDDTNITCTGYRLTIEGQTHMLLGDTSEDEMRNAYKRLGNYLKSDFVQLAHHGHGSFNSPFELYQFVDADVVFIPGPPARGAAEKWAVSNAKETYVRTDGTVTLELPHIVK